MVCLSNWPLVAQGASCKQDVAVDCRCTNSDPAAQLLLVLKGCAPSALFGTVAFLYTAFIIMRLSLLAYFETMS